MSEVKSYDGIQTIDTETCKFCKGFSAVMKGRENGKPVYMTSKEWCTEAKTCAATIEWEEIFNS